MCFWSPVHFTQSSLLLNFHPWQLMVTPRISHIRGPTLCIIQQGFNPNRSSRALLQALTVLKAVSRVPALFQVYSVIYVKQRGNYDSSCFDVILLSLCTEKERRVKANARDYNGNFSYAVSGSDSDTSSAQCVV